MVHSQLMFAMLLAYVFIISSEAAESNPVSENFSHQIDKKNQKKKKKNQKKKKKKKPCNTYFFFLDMYTSGLLVNSKIIMRVSKEKKIVQVEMRCFN